MRLTVCTDNDETIARGVTERFIRDLDDVIRKLLRIISVRFRPRMNRNRERFAVNREWCQLDVFSEITAHESSNQTRPTPETERDFCGRRRPPISPPGATLQPRCDGKPCLSACPVQAFSGQSFAVDACRSHLRGPLGAQCVQGGCLARNACPEGADYRYQSAHAAFHMQAFLRPQAEV